MMFSTSHSGSYEHFRDLDVAEIHCVVTSYLCQGRYELDLQVDRRLEMVAHAEPMLMTNCQCQ